jgi:hypothetical protein
MSWNKLGRGTLASILSLALVSVTACSRDYVLAYVYVTTAKPLTSGSQNGGVSAYAVDYQIGSLTPLADSPVQAGRNPVTLVASPSGLNRWKNLSAEHVQRNGKQCDSDCNGCSGRVSLRYLPVPTWTEWSAALFACVPWARRRDDLPDQVGWFSGYALYCEGRQYSRRDCRKPSEGRRHLCVCAGPGDSDDS